MIRCRTRFPAVRAATLLCLSVLCAATSAIAQQSHALPDFAFPVAPVRGTAPGGVALPLIDGKASESAPAISAVSEITLHGETLAITGHGLEGATLLLWAEGRMAEVEPLFAYGDRMSAVVPADFPASTMLVWPKRSDVYGAPIRVNAATAWWSWPTTLPANNDGSVLYVQGKNLQVGESHPLAFLQGEGFADTVRIDKAEPYQLKLVLPSLKEGDYRLWVHNGSGGRYGWSEPLNIRISKANTDKRDAVIYVADFGATADSGADAREAILQAIAQAGRKGGAVVQFERGVYTLSAPLVIDVPNVTLRGAGRGDYIAGAETANGEATVLTYPGGDAILPVLVEIGARGVALEAMTIVNAHDGNDRHVIAVRQPDARLDDLRVVMLDRRDWGYANRGPWPAAGETRRSGGYATGIIDDGAVLVDTAGVANLTFINSEIHATGPGVQVGNFSGWSTMVSRPGSSSIWIEGVDFRGYYAGEPDGKTNAGASGRATGIVIYSGREVVVRGCSFESADRANRRIMGRTVLVFNTSARNLYFANNKSLNIGPHPSAIGMDTNQGEQYLVHYRYPYGGMFHVRSASADTLAITTADIQPFAKTRDPRFPQWDLTQSHFHYNTNGSKVPEEVGTNDNWLLFVSAGKGAGQFREVTAARKDGADGYTFTLSRPWRVEPDASSRVNLMPAYRQIVIYNNLVDTGTLVRETKTHGVTFWFESMDNIVDGNTFRNMTSGIVFNSRFRAPTAWNTTRNNVIENMYGYPGDTSEKATGYVDHTRLVIEWPKPEDRVWYQVGNVARGNVIRNAEVGAYLHTRYTGAVRTRKPPVVAHPDAGMVLSIIENNRFENVDEGIVISSPVNAAVIRDNKIGLAAGARSALVDNQDTAAEVIDTVIVGNEAL